MTSDMRMYRTVQTASDPRIPIGMSRCGFFASCAAVDTASNPMYAKKITAAPRTSPDNPKCPVSPVLAGMNGCQLSELTYMNPNPITSATMQSLTMTMML